MNPSLLRGNPPKMGPISWVSLWSHQPEVVHQGTNTSLLQKVALRREPKVWIGPRMFLSRCVLLDVFVLGSLLRNLRMVFLWVIFLPKASSKRRNETAVENGGTKLRDECQDLTKLGDSWHQPFFPGGHARSPSHLRRQVLAMRMETTPVTFHDVLSCGSW